MIYDTLLHRVQIANVLVAVQLALACCSYRHHPVLRPQASGSQLHTSLLIYFLRQPGTLKHTRLAMLLVTWVKVTPHVLIR